MAMSPSRSLSRPYVSVFGAPILDRVDPRIFSLTYFGKCMDCTFCRDACCQYGADIEMRTVRALDEYQTELEAYLGTPRENWFRDDPDDIGIVDEPEYPSGQYTRTQVVDLPEGRSFPNEGACVFLDPNGRGCRLHRFALERKIQVHQIKPMVCLLFPLSFAKGELIPAYEFELDGELICEGPGDTIYRSARTDLLFYFGSELVAELDALEQSVFVDAAVARGVIPLPVHAG